MTAQIRDTFEDEGGESTVFDQAGKPFSPESVGLAPVAPNTALHRGFVCSYRLVERQLHLVSLGIGLADQQRAQARFGRGPVVDGRLPKPDDSVGFRYVGLSIPCPFTGALLIVRGWNPERFGRRGPVLFGFMPIMTVLTYDFVAEYSFVDGVLADLNDLSSVVRDLHRFAVAEGSIDEANRRFREHSRFFKEA